MSLPDGSLEFFLEAWLVASVVEAQTIMDNARDMQVPDKGKDGTDTGGVCSIMAILDLDEPVIDARACLLGYGAHAQQWCRRHLDGGYQPKLILADLSSSPFSWGQLASRAAPPTVGCAVKDPAQNYKDNQELKSKGQGISIYYRNPETRGCRIQIAILVAPRAARQLGVKYAAREGMPKVDHVTYESAKKSVVDQTWNLMKSLREHLCMECRVVEMIPRPRPLSEADRRNFLQLPEPIAKGPVFSMDIGSAPTKKSGKGVVRTPKFAELFEYFAHSWENPTGGARLEQLRSFGFSFMDAGSSSSASVSNSDLPECEQRLRESLAPPLDKQLRNQGCSLLAYIPIKDDMESMYRSSVGRSSVMARSSVYDGNGSSIWHSDYHEAPLRFSTCISPLGEEHEAPIETSGLFLSVCFRKSMKLRHEQRDLLANRGFYPTQVSHCKVGSKIQRVVSQEFWLRRDPRLRVQPAQFARLNCGGR